MAVKRAHRPATAVEPSLPELLREGALQAAIELFEAYGVRMAPEPRPSSEVDAGPDPISFISVSGFQGPQYGGCIVLGANETVLRRSNQTSVSPEEWLVELANQLVGRIKNRLSRAGQNIERMPSVVIKGAVAHVGDAWSTTPPLGLVDGFSAVRIWLPTEPSATAALKSVPVDESEVLAEGEMILF